MNRFCKLLLCLAIATPVASAVPGTDEPGAKKAQVVSEKQDEAGLKGLYDEKEDVLDSIHKLTNEQLTATHKKMDADGDGKVSFAEVKTYAHDMRRKIANKHLDGIIKGHDFNKDGKLDMDEYMSDLTHKIVPPDARAGQEELKQHRLTSFKEYDLNNDGYLDKDEMPLRWHHHHNDVAEERISQASLKKKDSNGDGKLDPEEFWSHMYGGKKKGTTAAQKQDFDDLDKDKSGFLTLDEVRHWESGAHHTNIGMQELFDVADTNKDNFLTVTEFTNAKMADISKTKHAHSHVRQWHVHDDL